MAGTGTCTSTCRPLWHYSPYEFNRQAIFRATRRENHFGAICPARYASYGKVYQWEAGMGPCQIGTGGRRASKSAVKHREAIPAIDRGTGTAASQSIPDSQSKRSSCPILPQHIISQRLVALFRFSGVDKVHRRENAELARLGHGGRVEIQGLRYANRSLRRDVKRFERFQRIVGDPATEP